VIATCLFGIGLVALNLAFVTLVSGVAIPIGWAAAAAALAVPARAVTRSRPLVYAVVGGQLLLAVGHVLVYDAPLDTLSQGHLSDLWPILAIAASAFLVARITPPEEVDWKAVTDATALAAVAYGTVVLLDGVWLAVAWAAEAALLAEAGKRFAHRVSAAGAFGFLPCSRGAARALLRGAARRAGRGRGSVLAGAPRARRDRGRRGVRGHGTIGLFRTDRMLLGFVSGTSPRLPRLHRDRQRVPAASVELDTGKLTVREQGQALLSAF
jgi:hypothetical protein